MDVHGKKDTLHPETATLWKMMRSAIMLDYFTVKEGHEEA